MDVHTVLVPEWFKDGDNPDNPLGSRAVRAAHVATAVKQHYELSDLLAMSGANPGIDDRVDRVLQAHPVRAAQTQPEELTIQLLNDHHFNEH